MIADERQPMDTYPIADAAAGSRVVEMTAAAEEPLDALCRRIRTVLDTDHARCDGAPAIALQQALRDPASAARAELVRGFHTLVVVETSRGLNDWGAFEHDRLFLPYLRDLLFDAFAFEPTEAFHPEQVIQVLKDVPRSLFCFVDAQHLTEADTQRLRAFTQGHHRVVLCGAARRLEPARDRSPERPAPQPTAEPTTSSAVATLEINSNSLSRYFELGADAILIGRDPDSDIHIDSPSVSRKHARIIRLDRDRYAIASLSEVNATYLNGHALPRGELTPLEPGSSIRIGEFVLVFNAVAASEDDPVDIFEMETQNLPGPKWAERSRAVAEAMSEISRILIGTAGLDGAMARILELLGGVYPRAERGVLMTLEPDGPRPRATYSTATAAARGPARPSKAVLDRVIRQGQPLRVGAEERFVHGAGEIDFRAAICAPITGGGGAVLGLIQFDSGSADAKFEPEELGFLTAISGLIGLRLERDRLHGERAALLRAGEVQAAMLPARPLVPGYTFWESYQPWATVSGDYYDYIRIDETPETSAGAHPPAATWAVAVGDISGKGLPAALIMARISPLVRYLVQSGLPAQEVVARLNRDLCLLDAIGMFATLVLVVLDPTTHRLTIVNAGFDPPLVRRRGGRIERIDSEINLPLGIDPQLSFTTVETTLEPSDVVVLLSDGVTDAMNASRERFGEERLFRVIRSTEGGAAQVGAAILLDVNAYLDGRSLFDDLTLVCFGREEA